MKKEINKWKNSELYKETNQKFVGRVEHMLYDICGMDFERAREVLIECLKRNKEKLNKLKQGNKK